MNPLSYLMEIVLHRSLCRKKRQRAGATALHVRSLLCNGPLMKEEKRTATAATVAPVPRKLQGLENKQYYRLVEERFYRSRTLSCPSNNCCKGVILTDLNMVHGTVGNLSIHLPFHNLSELLVAGASVIILKRHDSCPSLVAVTLAPQTLLFVRFDDFFANPGAVFGLFLGCCSARLCNVGSPFSSLKKRMNCHLLSCSVASSSELNLRTCKRRNAKSWLSFDYE